MGFSHSKTSEWGGALRSWHAGALACVVLVLAVSYKFYSDGRAGFFFESVAPQEFMELGGRRLPQYSMLTPSLLHSIWPLVLLALILGIVALRLANAMARSRRQTVVVSTDGENGASAVEFVLVLPALAVLLLMILQIALIVQAKFLVNYAAFCAARSAIVVIPDEVGTRNPPEPRNHIGSPETSEKIEIIHRSAALPLAAISPLPGFDVARGVPVLTNPDVMVDLLKLAPFDVGPESMMGQVMLRAPYAYHPDNTAVKVVTADGTEEGTFRDHDWVTVKVSYRYYLAVPFAKKLFGTAYSGNPFWTMIFGTDYYYPIVEQYTLPVDGEPMLP
jgi:hypothetical protein